MEALDATVIAVSTDSQKKQAEFRAKLEAPFPFVADTEAKLVEQFGVKVPVVKIANRVTFVIGAGRKIVAVIEGGDAIDPGKTMLPAGTR